VTATIRDRRTRAEIHAAQAMRWRANWPWLALQSVVDSAAVGGQTREAITEQIAVDWWFIASQYRQHGTELPPALKEET
jgi:hypothetical protein